MIFGLIQIMDSVSNLSNSDSLNAAKEIVKDTVVMAEKSFGNITFDYTKIHEGGGYMITFVGLTVVFLSLLFLSIFFVYVTKLLQLSLLKKQKEQGCADCKVEDLSTKSGEIDAAISVALHLYFSEKHDFENTVLTINKVQRIYSPWSSKIYGLRNYPRK